MDWPELLPRLAALGAHVAEVSLPRLEKLRELVLAENARTNLTRIVDPGEFVEKHVLDSLVALAHVPGDVRSFVDVGSGGGFPGLPLAIARPEWSALLVESSGKKASFLERAARELGLSNVRVVSDRAEDAARRPENRDAFDLATARAVGSTSVVLELTLPFVRVGGHAVLYRGPEEADQDDAASRASSPLLGGGDPRAIAYDLPSGARRRLILAKKLAATPDRFPRKAGIAAKRPLA